MFTNMPEYIITLQHAVKRSFSIYTHTKIHVVAKLVRFLTRVVSNISGHCHHTTIPLPAWMDRLLSVIDSLTAGMIGNV